MRKPAAYPPSARPGADEGGLEVELLGEQAAALGLAEKKMLDALADFRAGNGDPRRTQAAADAVQAFFIQREIMGMRAHDFVIGFYDIPPFVLSHIGIRAS